ncbi:hypothetical protein Gogos_001922 [Gossypium gossypioides]|uniref:Uncharacterized protein n=1 Tax=Gossypium gossypioides TaxID=34282 RepID=A0A7J9CQ30_GOSGO|nr:hypothetical protein [Gossypium gossypioides]
MAMKLKSTLPFVPLIVFLSFTLLVFTLEARTLSPNHFPHAGQGGHGLQLDEVFKVLDLLGIKDSSGPSHGGGGH